MYDDITDSLETAYSWLSELDTALADGHEDANDELHGLVAMTDGLLSDCQHLLSSIEDSLLHCDYDEVA